MMTQPALNLHVLFGTSLHLPSIPTTPHHLSTQLALQGEPKLQKYLYYYFSMKCQFPTKNSLSFKIFFLLLFLKLILLMDGGHGSKGVGSQNVYGVV